MYKAAARWLIRRNIAELNAGNYEPALRMFTADATLVFPGDNSWARMYREPGTGRHAVPTHRGRAEIEGFLQSFVAHRLHLEIEDILVNGPPWNMRVAVVAHDYALADDGTDVYANRAVLYARGKWGKLIAQEDFEDTERAAAFDEFLSAVR